MGAPAGSRVEAGATASGVGRRRACVKACVPVHGRDAAAGIGAQPHTGATDQPRDNRSTACWARVASTVHSRYYSYRLLVSAFAKTVQVKASTWASRARSVASIPAHLLILHSSPCVPFNRPYRSGFQASPRRPVRFTYCYPKPKTLTVVFSKKSRLEKLSE